jgi:protein SCO1/2
LPGKGDETGIDSAARDFGAILVGALVNHFCRGLRRAGSSLAVRLLVAGAAIALLGGCGGSEGKAASGQTGVPNGQSTSTNPKYAGVAAAPAKPAPPLVLNDSLGQPVNIDQYRGRAVLVTFIYTHCPDVCPLIVGNLHTALAQLGQDASKVQVVAVSVDPRGDTPRTVRAFLRTHRMTGRMEYLIGSRPQLENVWRAWNVLAKGPHASTSPDVVEHSALIYGISASGEITTLYPANFSPGQVAHDVPILASE